MKNQEIAKRLVMLRGVRPQYEVANAIGVRQSTYSMYEKGLRIPSDEKKKKIAIYFNTSVQSIFFD